MKEFILFYVVSQLLSTAYGVAVIESIRPFVKSKLNKEGYVLKNKNSLYKYNSTLINILKAFIPFYYTFKAINLINSKDPLNKALKNEIKSGNYISKEEIESLKREEENSIKSIYNYTETIVFEKPEKYTARKNDNSLYDTYITPIEYVISDSKDKSDLNLTPFMNNDRVVEHVMVKDNVTKSDIAKAIGELDSEELDILIPTLIELSEVKKKNKKFSLKDAA